MSGPERPSEEPQPMGPQAMRLMEGLRAFAADYTYLTQHLARWLGVHSADAAAFAEILYAEDKGDPLTPTRLAERIALTTGATASLLNRLERADLLVRTREHADRRVVTLRSVPAITGSASAFFAPLAARVGELLADYPAETLREMEQLLGDLHELMGTLMGDLDELVGERHTPLDASD